MLGCCEDVVFVGVLLVVVVGGDCSADGGMLLCFRDSRNTLCFPAGCSELKLHESLLSYYSRKFRLGFSNILNL